MYQIPNMSVMYETLDAQPVTNISIDKIKNNPISLLYLLDDAVNLYIV